MPVKLCVVNEEDEGDSPSDYLFEEDRVTIGRAEENDLTIPDPKRVVSSEHAMVTCEGNTYQLIDRGSKNFTYVGNQRITAQEPYELSDGDTFRIGDFRLEFRVIEQDSDPLRHRGETVFDHDFSNPFEDPVQQLQVALTALADAYDREPAQRRDEALKDAFRGMAGDLADRDGVREVVDMLETQQSDATDPTGRDTSSVSYSSASRPESSPSRPAHTENKHRSFERPVRAPNPVADSVIEALSEAIAEVVPIPWRFRHEFIGQTIMQAPETQFLHQGNGQSIKAHLMDPSISKEEREDRLDLVMEAAESVGVHQVAMLNGYKASVMDGGENLLEILDPDTHERDVRDQNILFEYVPMLASPAVLERLRTKWQELHQGDSAVAEQRIFRPAFTKAYLARMTAPRTANGNSGDETGTQDQHR